MSPASEILLDLEGLQVMASWRPNDFDEWANVAISVTAFPFAGTLETILTKDDLIHSERPLAHSARPAERCLVVDGPSISHWTSSDKEEARPIV